MSNWLKKLFGVKECSCQHCDHCGSKEEKQPIMTSPVAPEVKPEVSQPENVEKAQ